MPQLKRLHLENFRSIQNADIEFGRLNVLIGANGSGKSNLISFFKMMNEMVEGRLQEYIAQSGRAHSILHFGPKVSTQLTAELDFHDDHLYESIDRYRMNLFLVAGDTLAFKQERVESETNPSDYCHATSLGSGHLESRLLDYAPDTNPLVLTFSSLLYSCRVFHFHDTSKTARTRQYCYAHDSGDLLPDGANIAAILLRKKTDQPTIYRKVVETIQLIAPFFDDFILEATPQHEVMLNWRQKGTDLTFGPHQFSDGTLRAICLVTLLLQRPEKLPWVLIVDEPELGLHPYALKIIASLFQAASEHVQVIISTQSSTLLDHFDPEDVIVAEHHDGKSTFHRPGAEKLDAWLEEYSLGEIWEKNVIGGGPH